METKHGSKKTLTEAMKTDIRYAENTVHFNNADLAKSDGMGIHSVMISRCRMPAQVLKLSGKVIAVQLLILNGQNLPKAAKRQPT